MNGDWCMIQYIDGMVAGFIIGVVFVLLCLALKKVVENGREEA